MPQKGVVRIFSNTLPCGADGILANASASVPERTLPAAAKVVDVWLFSASKSDASNVPSPMLMPTAASTAAVNGFRLTDCPVAPMSSANTMLQTVGAPAACPLIIQGNGWAASSALDTDKLHAPSAVDV